jgi:predicted RNase H-like HicB family nuclease
MRDDLLAGEYLRERERGSSRDILLPILKPRSTRVTFQVTIDRDEDGIWIAECPSIPGCVSQGKTKEEALENVKEAIAVCLEVTGRARLAADHRDSAG